MPKSPAVADAKIIRALAAYAGMVDHVLTNPQRWLGPDEDPPAYCRVSGPRRRRVA